MIKNIEFLHPDFLWLLLIIPLLIAWYALKNKDQVASLKISNLNSLKEGQGVWLVIKHCLFGLRLLAIILVVFALARPQVIDTSTKIKKTEGIDIIMAIDVSGSMLCEDLKPNRLEALKKVAENFIAKRPNDRIGIVEYAAESYTKTPITIDKKILLKSIRSVEYSKLLEDGTAIGMGLATAVNRIKDSKAESKIIILLTDGKNNQGLIDPITASELAIECGIKTYTIGLGKSFGMVPCNFDGRRNLYPAKDQIDEELLKEIAKNTGGKFFRATDNKKLEEIYAEIDKLEKTEINAFKYYSIEEKFRPFVLLALGLIVFEFIIRNTILRGFI